MYNTNYSLSLSQVNCKAKDMNSIILNTLKEKRDLVEEAWSERMQFADSLGKNYIRSKKFFSKWYLVILTK